MLLVVRLDMKLFLILFPVIAIQNSFAQNSETAPSTKPGIVCDTIKVEPCTEFKGRARAYMGRAETRIWKIGTHRLFAVTEKSNEAALEIDKVNFHQELYATFNVCPVSKYIKGAMQKVCVASVTNASVKTTGQ
jgi:sulfur relay (sulfurtransferase) DsrC/TusE family protein